MVQTTPSPQPSFPLVDLSDSHSNSSQDKQNVRSSNHRVASVIYTRARSLQDAHAPVSIKKEGEREVMLLRNSTHLEHDEVVIKDPLLWASTTSDHDSENVVETPTTSDIEMEIPMLRPLSSNHRMMIHFDPTASASTNIGGNIMFEQQYLERNFRKRDTFQSRAGHGQSSAQQISLLIAKKETLETAVRQKDAAIRKLEDRLLATQREVENLQESMEEKQRLESKRGAEMNVQQQQQQHVEALDEEGLIISRLLCRLIEAATFLENHLSAYVYSSEDPAVQEVDDTNFCRDRDRCAILERGVESLRKKYLDAIAAARENPSEDDAILLASVLREQLRGALAEN